MMFKWSIDGMIMALLGIPFQSVALRKIPGTIFKLNFMRIVAGSSRSLHSDESLVTELRSDDKVGTSDGTFTINSSTGAVTLIDNPDYEQKSLYTDFYFSN